MTKAILFNGGLEPQQHLPDYDFANTFFHDIGF